MKNVNAAIKAIKDQKTELLCQPWVYGNYPLHIPNNADFTTTPDNGKMVTAQGCFNVSSDDPQIAALPQGRRHGTVDESTHLLGDQPHIRDHGA